MKDHKFGSRVPIQRLCKKDDEEKRSRYGVLKSFLQNRGSLRHFISRFLVPHHEIEDIAQEAFLRAYEVEKRRQIDEPKAFLFRIARNLILTEFRSKSRKITDYIEDFEDQEILLEGESLETSIMAQQKLGIFCESLAALPPQCRKVVLLKKVYGLTHKEIAEQLNITVSTIEKHLSKGIRQCDKVISERYKENSCRHRVREGSADVNGRDTGSAQQ